jgi:hypothetical protein
MIWQASVGFLAVATAGLASAFFSLASLYERLGVA